MKKITALILITCGAFILHTSFTTLKKKHQQTVKVTVRIDRLRAISHDACNGKMDFKGKITIYQAKKSFPVMEGNDIRPGWEFTANSTQKGINIYIEIWDDDDAICGGGDDAVIVSTSGSQALKITLDPKNLGTKTTTVFGKKVSGKEQGEITFTTTIAAL